MRETVPQPRGRVRLARATGPVAAPTWTPTTRWRPNLVMLSWGLIAAPLVARGDPAYRVNGMFIEFENVADPDAPVAAPAYGRGREYGAPYYASLAGSATKDYIRVPVFAAVTSNSNPALFDGDNVATFFAQSTGVVGVHGKPFSDADNSKVYGTALVAMVDEGDASRDVVFSRYYLPGGEQQVKLATSRVGVEWEMAFG